MSHDERQVTTLKECIAEWRSKKRRMGCVAATDFLCRRVPGFEPVRLTRYTITGEKFQHIVATDGVIHVDLAPWNDRPVERS